MLTKSINEIHRLEFDFHLPRLNIENRFWFTIILFVQTFTFEKHLSISRALLQFILQSFKIIANYVHIFTIYYNHQNVDLKAFLKPVFVSVYLKHCEFKLLNHAFYLGIKGF